MSAATGEPLGTAAEEAARLLESLNGWFDARTSAASDGPPDDDPTRGGRAQTPGPPRTTGATSRHDAACRVCPLCRGLAYLEESHPDVLTHLADAAAHLVAAVRSLTEPAADPAGCDGDARGADVAKSPGPPSRAVRIDVQPDPGVAEGTAAQMDSEPREPGAGPAVAGQRVNSASEEEPAP